MNKFNLMNIDNNLATSYYMCKVISGKLMRVILWEA